MSDYQPHGGPLGRLNQNFHDSYEELVDRTLQRLGQSGHPVIIMRGTVVSLLQGGQRIDAEVVPDIYHKLKAISHVPLGLFTVLTDSETEALYDATLDRMRATKQLIEETLDGLGAEDFSTELQDKQVLILKACVQMIDAILGANRMEEGALYAFTQVVAPLLLDSADVAVKALLDNLHTTVMKWRAMLDEGEWRSLHVIICAGHQARSGEATKQYFDRLLGEREGFAAEFEERVIVAEALSEDSAVLDLLARHIIDQQAAASFFRSRFHLQKDLLAHSASTYLDSLFDT